VNGPRIVVHDDVILPDFTRDVANHVVDLRPAKWRLNSVASSQTLIDWTHLLGCDEEALAALRLHLVRLIETSSPDYVRTTFQFTMGFLVSLRDQGSAPGKTVNLETLMWYLERLRANRSGYKFHHIRQWYIASADRMLEGFDDEVVYALEDLRIEGNAKGLAVLSSDPNRGPLSEFEEEALRSALLRDDGPIDQRAALWLAFAYGTNPSNIALLREEDFRSYHFGDGTPSEYFLNIPRIKKRMPPRTEFKARLVDGRLARIIDELIEHNRAVAPGGGSRPLFRTAIKRANLVDGPLHEYAYHNAASGITGLIAQCSRRLDVVSPRTGEPLVLNSRRLRYTFASKMVRQGVTARDLAELLDHTDTQNVQVYYVLRALVVERDELLATNHDRIANQLDRTILAVGDVVARTCERA
jgi:integrase